VHIFMPIKGKQVRFLHGPAAVMGRLFRLLPLETGKAWRVDEPKSEDLPADNTGNSTSDRGGVW